MNEIYKEITNVEWENYGKGQILSPHKATNKANILYVPFT